MKKRRRYVVQRKREVVRVLSRSFAYFPRFFQSKKRLIATKSPIMAMSFALDHDYCSVAPSDQDFNSDTPSTDTCTDETRPKAKRKEVLCPRVDPDMESLPVVESVNLDVRSSSLSPAHSMDSGVDAGVEDFLADFATSWGDEDFGLNEEDIKDLEALLEISENSEHSDVAETRRITKPNVQSCKKQQISEEEDKAIAERNKKNAIAARENRQKKKKYVEGLENDVAELKEENKTLKSRNESMTTMIKKLSDEVKYLRSVLANESTISLLLKSVASTPGISLSSSLTQSSGSEGSGKENVKEGERQYVTRSKKRRSEDEASPSKRTRSSSSGGVCLHVNNGKVSLELCAKCERKATQSGFL